MPGAQTWPDTDLLYVRYHGKCKRRGDVEIAVVTGWAAGCFQYHGQLHTASLLFPPHDA